MKVFFVPYYQNNPYQQKLIDELEMVGIHINIGNTGANAFFKTEGLNSADILHFHWFEPFLKSNSFFKSLFKCLVFLIRLKVFTKNKKIVWTVHNLVNHEKKNVFIDQLFLYFFTKWVAVFCVHNEYSKMQLIKQLNIDATKIKIIPHGNYISDYPIYKGNIDKFRKEKTALDANKLTFAFIGNIRPYKGVIELIEVFKKLKNQRKIQLLIAGHITFKEDEELIKGLIKDSDNIFLASGYINNNEMDAYFKLSNVLIYPYKDILTSGALILGMSMGKLCVVSNVGSMRELIKKDYLFNNNLELNEKLNTLSNKNLDFFKYEGQYNKKKIKENTWGNMAIELKKVYKELKK